MLGTHQIGTPLLEAIARAEADQMRLFARATGQTDPIFFDEQAARAQGYRDIVAPPTFAYALQQSAGCDPFELFDRLGVALEDTLHGEQCFEYGAPICAGDTIAFSGAVVDIFSRKDRLDFLVYESRGINQRGEMVSHGKSTTIVVRR